MREFRRGEKHSVNAGGGQAARRDAQFAKLKEQSGCPDESRTYEHESGQDMSWQY